MNPWQKIARYPEKPTRLVIGLMSGTSADGTDAALVRIGNVDAALPAQLIASVFLPFPDQMRKMILEVSHGQGNAETISRLSVELAREYSLAVTAVCEQAGVERDRVDAIGCHGQTISHTPHGPFPSTLQIGDASGLAYRTRIPVVSNFRAADVAAGGQGAPLVPFADWKLFTHPTKNRAVQNIGGIANVTYLPANGSVEEVIGFDTGPGNMLIDLAMEWATGKPFDEEGQFAATGRLLPKLMEWLFTHPFLEKQSPKSAGREEFGIMFWERIQEYISQNNVGLPGGHSHDNWLYSPTEGRHYYEPAPEDIVATLTAFTAYSIADAYVQHLPTLPDEVIVSGGGAKNKTLMQYLTQKLATITVSTSDAVGINIEMREAIAFALLADETLQGGPINLPAVTGAKRRVLSGSLTLPG